MDSTVKEKEQSLFKIVRDGGITVFSANFILKLLGFLSTIIVLRELSVYDYGVWRLLLSIITFSLIVTLPSIDGFIGADLGRELGSKNTSLYKSMFLKISSALIMVGLVASIILFFSAPFVTKVSGIDLTLYIRLLSISLIFSVISRIYKFAFSTHLKFNLNNGIGVLNKILYLLILFVLFFWFDLKILAVVIAYVGSFVGSVLLFTPFFIKTTIYLKNQPYSEYSIKNTILREHGKWGMISSYFDDFVSSVRPWIIGYFTSIEVVGLFSAAMSLFSEVSNFSPVNNVLNSVIPRLSQQKDKMFFLINRSLKYGIWIFSVLGLLAALFVPIAVYIFIPNYESSIPAFIILLISLFAIPANGIANSLLNTFRFQKELFMSSIKPQALSLLVILPISLVTLGLYGAVLDRILATYLVSLYRFKYTKKVLPGLNFKISDLFIFDSYDKNTFFRFFSKNK